MLNRFFIISYLLLSTLFVYAQQTPVFELINSDSVSSFELDRFWKFNNGDDTAWASPKFDDSSWGTTDTQFSYKDDSTVFTGIAWLRLRIYIDSSFMNEPLYFSIKQNGASEIYVDGIKLHSIGKVSVDKSKEKAYNPLGVPYALMRSESRVHVLAIRYSNASYKELYEKYGKNPGFRMLLVKQSQVESTIAETVSMEAIFISMGLFFITLGFVHFLLFLFNKNQKSNLFYSFFVISLGLIFIVIFYATVASDPLFLAQLEELEIYIISFFFYFMLVMEYSIFKRPLKMYFWFSTALFVLSVLSLWFSVDFVNYLILIFIISAVISSFFIVIKSIKDKFEGAWILGTGSLLFLIFLLIITVLLVINGGNLLIEATDGNDVQVLVFFTLILLSIMSIPLSMSVYLAWDFARTSKKLEKHIIEVEQLSAKTIEQEKEKQKILETQNDVLEAQVQERTIEITNQKTIIERKNKDITDSIDYAKTIQRAILPAMSVVKNSFPDSFILFKPKDIVSGDFYWVTEKNGKKIIAACDCTGHGVPGALMSMIGNNLLNHIVNDSGITAPDEILNQLHKEIRKTLKQEEQNEIRDGMDIAILVFENETKIEYAAAQRPLWILNKMGDEKWMLENEFKTQSTAGYQLTEIKGNKFSIGGIQSEKERLFTKHSFELPKGSTIYTFSDGYADQFSNTGKKLMSSRFKELLLKIQSLSMDEQGVYLNQYIDEFRGSNEQIDDILVIGIRV